MKRRTLFQKGLKAAPRTEADGKCADCARRVFLDADVEQRIGIRCLFCFRVYCVKCAEKHFARTTYFARIEMTDADIEQSAPCRWNLLRERPPPPRVIVHRKNRFAGGRIRR